MSCEKEPKLNLYPQTASLWPKKDDKVTIKVCWDTPRLETVYPIAEYAPDTSAALTRLKKSVEEIMASQWTELTSIEFTGWQECSAGDADFRIVPTDSSFAAPCGAVTGQSCAEAFGNKMIGKNVYLNVMFGEEFLYTSRYVQAHPDDYDANKDLKGWMSPQACSQDFFRPWSLYSNSDSPKHKVDINDPKVFKLYQETYKNCVQNVSLHEFGHVLGFAHEQYRQDDAAAQEECQQKIEARGYVDDVANVPPEFLGDVTIGPFDAESIMSYCRENPAATLTPVDIEMAMQVYDIDPPKRSDPPQNSPDEPGEPSNKCKP